MPNNSIIMGYLSHKQAAEYLGVHPDMLKQWCEQGRGPKRRMYSRLWHYKKEQLDKFTPVSFCMDCHAKIPYRTRRCQKCEEKRQATLAENRRLIKEGKRQRKKMIRYETEAIPGLKTKPYPCECPICHKKHIAHLTMPPSCKWVYCENHVGRREWREEYRVLGAGSQAIY